MKNIPLLDGEIIKRAMEKNKWVCKPALTPYICTVCMYDSHPAIMVMSDCSDG